MDKKEFHKLIEKSRDLSEKQIESLNNIIQDNPYFATARLMKVLDLLKKDDPNAHKASQISSLYIHDKSSIYDELLTIDLPEKETAIPDISKGPVGLGLGENKIEKNDFTNEILDEIAIIGKGVKNTVLESFAESISEDNPQSEKAEEKTNNTVEKKIQKEAEPKKEEVKSESKDGTKKSLADEVMESLAQMKKEREERQKKMEAIEKKEKENKSSAPLKSKSQNKKSKEETPSQEKKANKTAKTKKASSLKSKTAKSKEKSESKDTKKKPEKKAVENKAKSDQNIIESFINKNPRIKAPKDSDTNQSREDLSKPSTELPSNLVSENLANIFEKQGKISKAIAIYKQLILKYPEKKSYFAQKLETLEK